MSDRRKLDRETISNLVIECLRAVLSEREEGNKVRISESTTFYGSSNEAGLDSLELVTLVIDIEQKLESVYEITITLADDRAMSQRRSPFRSVGALTDYICQLIEDKITNG